MKIMTKQQIKEEFLAKELDYITAIERLEEHCHMDPKEAEALVVSWEKRVGHEPR